MANAEKSWLERYPAFRRLSLGERRGGFTLVRQLTASDCGAACLTMVLAHFGRHLRLEDVRNQLGLGRDGTSAAALLRVGRANGLDARAVRVDLDDLSCLPAGSILHWNFSHFVVLVAVRRRDVEILDPASGRRSVALDEVSRSFTGIALLFEPSDTFERLALPARTRRRYLRWVLAFREYWSRIIVTSLLLQLFAAAGPAVTGTVVDRIVPHGARDLLLVQALALTMLVAFHFIATSLRAHLLLHLRTLVDSKMTTSFVSHLLELPYGFFQQRNAGDLVTRLRSNNAIRDMLTSGALSGMMDGTLVVGYVVAIAILAPAMAFTVAVVGIVQVIALISVARSQRELMGRELAAQATLESYQIELLNGVETIKSMGGEERSMERWSQHFVDVLNVTLERGRLTLRFESLVSAVRMAGPLGVLVVGTLQVLDGRMSLGTMLALNALTGSVLGPIGSLVGSAMQMQVLGSYLSRLEEVFETASEQEAGATRAVARLGGAITLDRVSFRYSPMAQDVVRDVRLAIAPGQTVAIVGRSGAGKSTLAHLLLGLHVPTSGRILFDDVDLRTLDLRSVRSQVGVVTQRTQLFATTVRQNIALANPSLPLDAVMEAARVACLHDEILGMPLGYDTILGDDGMSLSGGQRQRLAIARAVANRPAILLLDEATSALDTLTERAVQNAVSHLACTRVIIAHRLSTIVDADSIVVLEDGAIVETGTHDDLVARNGVYAAQARAQGLPSPHEPGHV